MSHNLDILCNIMVHKGGEIKNSKHISLEDLAKLVSELPKYKIGEKKFINAIRKVMER